MDPLDQNTCLMDTLMSLNFPLNHSNSPWEIGVLCLTFLHFSSLTKFFFTSKEPSEVAWLKWVEPLAICISSFYIKVLGIGALTTLSNQKPSATGFRL